MISLVVAMSRNRVIGVQNKLPWHLPEDLKRFRQITTGHPIIMGRKTFDSIGKPLPNRTSVIITRNAGFKHEGCVVVNSLDSAIARASQRDIPGHEEVFVIGGGEIFREAIGLAHRIYLTLIDQEIPGDAYFPEFDQTKFRETARERREGPMPFDFIVLERS